MADTPTPTQQRFIDAAKRRAANKNKPATSTASRFVKAEQTRKAEGAAKDAAAKAAVHIPAGASRLQGKFISAEQKHKAGATKTTIKATPVGSSGGGTYSHTSYSKPSLKNAKRDEARRNASHVSGEEAKNNENAFFNYRQKRIANKDYKGKYYGPDVFKGDMSKLSKWRAAGSPKDKSRFV